MSLIIFSVIIALGIFEFAFCDEIPAVHQHDQKYNGRDTKHVLDILHAEKSANSQIITNKALKKLEAIYNEAVKPLKDAYKFDDISPYSFSKNEIFALPRVAFIGPWSTGKSSLINYFLDIENTSFALPSGAEPTTSDFTVLTHDVNHKTVEGPILVMDNGYSPLEKFGHKFLERLEGIRIPKTILKSVNFIDTPGIIENRKQQERSYPFADVCQWLIEYADLIILVFDPTKLDVGLELELLFKQLKEHEAKVRIVLNKADSLTFQELLRVYGALFWSLAPLMNTTEPPKVYVGSFWSKSFQPILQDFHNLFITEETSLISEIHNIMCNRVQTKIAFLRQHAVMVRNHALVVDEYLKALREHRSIFRDVNDIILSIMFAPHEYKIFQKVLTHSDVSKLDLFTESMYKEFFNIHSMELFIPLSKQCGFVSSCLLDAINHAIHDSLPKVLEEVELLVKEDCLAQVSSSKHEKEKYYKKLNKNL